MSRSLLGLAMAVLAIAACDGGTAVVVHIEGAHATPPLRSVDDIDQLAVSVELHDEVVWTEAFTLQRALAAVDETVVLRPGARVQDRFWVEVQGLGGGRALAAGASRAAFERGAVVEVEVQLAWQADVCVDADGDGHGRGPACLGADCDDANASANAGAPERCNGVDDDCDGVVDQPAALDPPRCALYQGVCADARQRCGGEAGWLACGADDYGSRYQALETECDGFDNDCDGAVDETCACTAGQTRPCDGPDLGTCDPGAQTCEQVGGSWLWGEACVGAVGPSPVESCDTRDDDCDGEVDEDFDLQTDVDHCGACDHACELAFGSGGCQGGACVLTGCEPGHHDANDDPDDGCEYPCTPTSPPEEVCDGADNDCDGRSDNVAGAPACALTQGVCAGATRRCDPAAGWIACTPEDYGPSYQLQESRCDGLDNDCDGAADGQDLDLVLAPCRLQEGVCLGAQHAADQCTASGWLDCGAQEYGPSYEPDEQSCDGWDNDCDGEEDGVPASACADTDPCTDDLCQGGGCVHQPRDLDGDGFAGSDCGGTDCDDGAFAVHPGADELCDAIDQDCDGAAWDVPGSAEGVIELGDCGLYEQPGMVSIARSPAGALGVAWTCEVLSGPGGWSAHAAVIDAGATLRWSGQLGSLGGGSLTPRVAAVGDDDFLVSTDTGQDGVPRFTLIDVAGQQGSVELPAASTFAMADLTAAPWSASQAVAVYADYNASPLKLYARSVSSAPFIEPTGVDVGVSSWCCGQVSHEGIATPDGVLVVGCEFANRALNARWLVGTHLATSGAAIELRSTCHLSPMEIRGALTDPTAASRALLAITEFTLDLHLVDVGTVGSATLLESAIGLPYVDAAPVPVGDPRRALVALRSNGEVVWLTSDQDLADLTAAGAPWATQVGFLDAVSLGAGRVAVALADESSGARVLLRQGTCAQ